MTTTDTIQPPADLSTILKLDGDGYKLSVTKETLAARNDLIAAAGAITQVTDADESTRAQFEIRRLAAFRNLVEKSRTEVKKPVIELGRKIDEAAQAFAGDIVLEEIRIKKLVGKHAEEVAAAKRAAEAEERRKFEEARRAKEDAERAAADAERAKQAAANAVSIQDAIKAKQAAREAETAAAKAEQERQAAQAERMAASTAVATTNVASGVRFEPDFEVLNIDRLAAFAPHLVMIEPKRREVIAYLKQRRADGANLEMIGLELGLKITLKPVVSTR